MCDYCNDDQPTGPDMFKDMFVIRYNSYGYATHITCRYCGLTWSLD